MYKLTLVPQSGWPLPRVPLKQGGSPCSSPTWPPGPRQGWAARSDRFWQLELRVSRTFLDQLRPRFSGHGYPAQRASGDPRRAKQIRNDSSRDQRAVETNVAACQGEASGEAFGHPGSAGFGAVVSESKTPRRGTTDQHGATPRPFCGDEWTSIMILSGCRSRGFSVPREDLQCSRSASGW